jgi:hypothetical protein
LVDNGFGNGEVQVEPNELLPVVLGEVTHLYGNHLRMIRAGQRQVTIPDFIKSAASRGPGRMLVLLGEAGVGKTTMARLISRSLVADKNGAGVLPLLIHLGLWDSQRESIDQAADRELGFSSVVSLLSRRPSDLRLVLILDGLNEQPEAAASRVMAYARRLVVDYNATAIITTRPVTPARHFVSVDHLHVYEMNSEVISPEITARMF